MKERINESTDMEQALRNFELHWRKQPAAEMRTYLGLSPLSTEQFKAEVELEQGKIAEIARQQKEGWE